jgi:hypothetical protein
VFQFATAAQDLVDALLLLATELVHFQQLPETERVIIGGRSSWLARARNSCLPEVRESSRFARNPNIIMLVDYFPL